MTTRILPQEFLFQESLTPIQVQTAVSKELIGDGEMLVQHVRHYRLAVGTVILVQVMNEDKDTLLHEAEFRVTVAQDQMRVVEDDYGTKSRGQTLYKVERWTPWRSSSLAPAEKAKAEPERDTEAYVPGEGVSKWNPGKQAYDVIVGGEVCATVARHDGEQKEDYKARALAIAAGSQPLPKAA